MFYRTTLLSGLFVFKNADKTTNTDGSVVQFVSGVVILTERKSSRLHLNKVGKLDICLPLTKPEK